MTIAESIIFGIVQGLTEFLPVSSSGHLVLANYYFFDGDHLPLYVDIATNTGTLLAVLVALRQQVWLALSGFLAGLRSKAGRQSEGWRLAILVIIASIPTAIIGLGLKDVFEMINRPIVVCFSLIVTGIVLWFAPRGGNKERPKQLSYLDALIGGIAQGIAVFPGVSRAGLTIATMLTRGASSKLAPDFSFLLYLVASFGVALIGIDEVRNADLDILPLVAMVASSFVVGYAAILWLMAILKRGQFRWFAPYLWAIAAFTLFDLFILRAN